MMCSLCLSTKHRASKCPLKAMLQTTAKDGEIPQIFHNTYYRNGMTAVQSTLFTAPRAHAKPWEST